MKLTPFETVWRHTSLQMGCSTCSTVRGPHSSVLHCVPKSHMKIGSPVASSCNIGTELGPPSEQNPCTFEVKVTESGCNGWRLFLHEYWHPSIGGGGDGGGRGSGGGGFGSGGIGASVKDSAVMEGMRPSPQSVLRTRLDMGRRVSVGGKYARLQVGRGVLAYLSVKYAQTCVHESPSTCTKTDGFSGVDSRPSSQILSLANAHESSPGTACSTLRTSSRGPH